MPGEFAVPLSGQYDFLHHAGAAGDRRHTLQQRESEAESVGSARVLSQGCGALQPRCAAISARRNRLGRVYDYGCRKVIVATGYYDRANLMRVPGEDLPKVFHYYREPHPYFDCDVLVVGGKNSAAISALDLWRHGARVTLVHRGSKMHSHVKYWILPDIENRIKNGEITAYFNTTVREIEADYVALNTPQGEVRIKNDFVFALTGYHPDYEFLRSMGIELSTEQCRPVCDPITLESNVPGIYVAGVIVAGSRTNEIFIENGRFHGQQIASHLRQTLTPKG